MIRYRVLVETPHHGELFEARCDSGAIAAVLAAAAASIVPVEDALRHGVPVRFTVEVGT